MSQTAPSSMTVAERLPDGGPIYLETNLDAVIKEPFNMVTALFFLFIAVWWSWYLAKEVPPKRIMQVCMAILALGGIGGAMFHGFRLHWFWLMLDVVPIALLVSIFSGWLWIRLMGGLVPGVIAIVLTVSAIGFVSWWSRDLANVIPFAKLLTGTQELRTVYMLRVSFGYMAMGLSILTPLLVWLAKSHWFAAKWVWFALTAFGLALYFRTMDAQLGHILPMGGHFLWHTFGAVASASLVYYWYLVLAKLEGQGTLQTN